MEHRVLTDERGFRCRLADFRERATRSAAQQQETEANTFAAELLAPPHLVRPFLAADPALDIPGEMTRDLDLSYEACVVRCVALHPEPVAAVWSKGGTVRYAVRAKSFPWVALKRGDRLPPLSQANRMVGLGRPGTTTLREAHAFPWTGRESLELSEQTHIMAKARAMTMLWATLPDEDDEGPGMPDLPQFGRR
jgi:hypothetical protein